MDKDKEIKLLKAEIEKLKSIAHMDELTGAYNRRGLKEEASAFISEVSKHIKFPERRKNLIIKNFSLIFFDIDSFKTINDTYGHDAGDKVIKFLVDTIQEKVRKIDLVSRWGGEEIVVGLPGAEEVDAYGIAEDIRDKLSNTSVVYKGEEIKFSVSGGVAEFNGTDSIEEFLDKADQAMYEAKTNRGKNNVVRNSEIS